MLVRLILFVVLFGGLWLLVYLWRQGQLPAGDASTGLLGVGEFETLMKLARRHPRLEQALQLRVNIIEAAHSTHKAELSERVDTALRRLASQCRVQARIEDTLRGIDKSQLAREVAGARAQAAEAETDDDEVHRLADALALQLEQVGQLEARRDRLEAASERILLELRNLNLALLQAESSEAAREGDAVQSVLAHLQDAGEELRRTTDAEDEVDRLLQTSRATSARRLKSAR